METDPAPRRPEHRRTFETLSTAPKRWCAWCVPLKTGAILWSPARETPEAAYGDLLELIRVELPALSEHGGRPLCGVVESTATSIYRVEEIWIMWRRAVLDGVVSPAIDHARVPR